MGGAYNDTDYAASFVGGGPYHDPRLVIALVVHGPDKAVSHFGGVVAAPAAGRILDRALAHLRVAPGPPPPPHPPAVAGRLWTPPGADENGR